MNTTVKITPAQVFPIANQIRKGTSMTMKEAYAKAKAQLILQMSEANNMVKTPSNMSMHMQLVERMNNGNVKFKFKNAKGKVITTTGTLIKDRIPTNRVVEGRKTPKDENTQVFYDVRHGVYRSYQKDQVVSIF